MLRGNGWIRSRQIFSNAVLFATSFPGGCVAGWITYPIYICTLCVSSDRKPAKHADERSYPGGTCVSLLTASVRPTPTNVAVRSEIVCLFWPQLLTCARSGWVVNMFFEWLLWHLWLHRPSFRSRRPFDLVVVVLFWQAVFTFHLVSCVSLLTASAHIE